MDEVTDGRLAPPRGEGRVDELGIVPDAYEPHLDVDFTRLRNGFDDAA
ncbi:hypothetical protein ABT383_04530 [Streptomyces humidus]|nr:hypothetical protein [Streptomyces humidus]